MNKLKYIKFDKKKIADSELTEIDKEILREKGFPCAPNVCMIHDYYRPSIYTFSHKLYGDEKIISIAKDSETDTLIVIRISNNFLSFYNITDDKFLFINSSLSLFFLFQDKCAKFFHRNPEFDDVTFSNNKESLKKLSNFS